jgi:methylmalonyl-CoA/ethylmalonyl-CoA epimerase
MRERPFKINHIGMAVPNIQRFLKTHDVFYSGFRRGPVIENTRQRVRELFLSDGSTTLELLEPSGPDSPIAPFLARNRVGGLLHVCIEVDDLDQALAAAGAAGGVVLVPPTPDVAFEERRIAFVVLDGQVTEIVERPRLER